MKIGFTERGDGGLDLSWLDKAKTGKCDGVVVIRRKYRGISGIGRHRIFMFLGHS